MRWLWWSLCALSFWGETTGPALSYVPEVPQGLIHKPLKKHHKKAKKKSKKKHKVSHHKKRKHKKRRKHRKIKIYSEKKIEEMLENDEENGTCNRLNCASSLKIAKECLKTKESHRSKTSCFRAFCAYGCNEEDYTTKADVFDFCNETCSSKKYLKNKKRPEEDSG